MALFSAENPPITAIGHARQCASMNRSGARCGRYALQGCGVCAFHGGYSERLRLFGTPYPAHVIASAALKREVTRQVRALGADELWQVDAFTRAKARGKLALLTAWQRSQAEHDPGILQRAIELEERQNWHRVQSDRP